MELTELNLLGIRLQEPVTVATDLVVSAVFFYGFFRLKEKKSIEKTTYYFKYYFLTMAIATLIGGILGHGFLYKFGMEGKFPGWVISMFSVMLLELAVIEFSTKVLNPTFVRIFKVINIIELTICLFLTLSTLKFIYVEIHLAYGLVLVAFTSQSYIYYKFKNKVSLNIIYAIGTTALSALVFANELSPHRWFNHVDISHLILALSAFLFYKGAMHIEYSPLENLQKAKVITDEDFSIYSELSGK